MGRNKNEEQKIIKKYNEIKNMNVWLKKNHSVDEKQLMIEDTYL